MAPAVPPPQRLLAMALPPLQAQLAAPSLLLQPFFLLVSVCRPCHPAAACFPAAALYSLYRPLPACRFEQSQRRAMSGRSLGCYRQWHRRSIATALMERSCSVLNSAVQQPRQRKHQGGKDTPTMTTSSNNSNNQGCLCSPHHSPSCR